MRWFLSFCSKDYFDWHVLRCAFLWYRDHILLYCISTLRHNQQYSRWYYNEILRFKVTNMFRKFCIVFMILVTICFCMVVIAKLQTFTTTVICMRIGDCWYYCFINNVFSKIFTVKWAAGWISAVTLRFLVCLSWWKYFLLVLFDSTNKYLSLMVFVLKILCNFWSLRKLFLINLMNILLMFVLHFCWRMDWTILSSNFGFCCYFHMVLHT